MSKKIFFNSKLILLQVLVIINSPNIIFCAKSTYLTEAITTKVLDKATGNLYLGLYSPAVSLGSQGDTISVAQRYYGTDSITTNTLLQNQNAVEYLALSTSECSKNPVIIPVFMYYDSTTTDTYVPQSQSTISAYSSNYPVDNISATSSAINDTTQNTTSGIVALDANNNYAFTLVKPNASGSTFGQTGSGLANIKITNNIINSNSLSLLQTDAQAGLVGIKRAKAIDPTIAQLKIINDPFITVAGAALYWDKELKRLYIGINQITANTTIGDGARSIIVANPETNGIDSFYNIAPDSAFAQGDLTQIVGVITGDTNYQTLGAKFIRTMHTSTGKSYLIVNGGNADAQASLPTSDITPGNTIYALPIVDNPQSVSGHGTLADYTQTDFATIIQENPSINNSCNSSFQRACSNTCQRNYNNNYYGGFTIAATTPDKTVKSTDIWAKVGAGPLPLENTQNISDMIVVGDTVFVSSSNVQALNSEPGIFYSQAMFDEYGRIYRWTPWSKRAFPLDGTSNGTIKFMDVDAYNGKIWAIDSISTSTLITNEWSSKYKNQNMTLTNQVSNETIAKSLLTALNTSFSDGCFCYLDLDSSTMGLGQYCPARYALFGGYETVAFIRTSTSFANSAPYDKNNATKIPYGQYIVQDFSSAENYLITYLPGQSGCINSLEFSRVLSNTLTQGYFFAGTQSGLYVFATNTGQGFLINDNLNTLNNSPFINCSWSKIDSIPGAVIDICSSGNALYVLTFETSAKNPITNKIYKINFANTVSQMFDSSNIKLIAQTLTSAPNSDLSSTKMFYAIKVMTKNNNSNTNIYEELVIATNNGLYYSDSTTGNGICNASDQSQAFWTLVSNSNNSAYTGIFSADNSNYLKTAGTGAGTASLASTAYETVWPTQLANKCSCCKSFEFNNINQVNGSIEDSLPEFNPQNFNAQYFNCVNCSSSSVASGSIDKKISCQNCINNNFNPIEPINYFWSDGARRFFVIKRTCDPNFKNKLFSIPYNIQDWMITNPKNQVIYDSALQKINAFYWLGPIGVTGIILAGTDSGLVALD